MELSEPSEARSGSTNNPDDVSLADGDGEITQNPEPDQDNKLDHRRLGDWGSRYPGRAWCQICIEFFYLAAILVLCAVALIWIGYYVSPPTPLDVRDISIFGFDLKYPRDRTFLLWISVGLSGTLGGTSFSLKWLYHSVAKALWNRDRILWRLIVPALSGTLAVFVSMLVASGLLSLIDTRFFNNFYGAVGAGWLVGYFSDNVLASLQKLAHKWFGTVDDAKGKPPAIISTAPPKQNEP